MPILIVKDADLVTGISHYLLLQNLDIIYGYPQAFQLTNEQHQGDIAAHAQGINQQSPLLCASSLPNHKSIRVSDARAS